jgi:hypothetical protein
MQSALDKYSLETTTVKSRTLVVSVMTADNLPLSRIDVPVVTMTTRVMASTAMTSMSLAAWLKLDCRKMRSLPRTMISHPRRMKRLPRRTRSPQRMVTALRMVRSLPKRTVKSHLRMVTPRRATPRIRSLPRKVIPRIRSLQRILTLKIRSLLKKVAQKIRNHPKKVRTRSHLKRKVRIRKVTLRIRSLLRKTAKSHQRSKTLRKARSPPRVRKLLLKIAMSRLPNRRIYNIISREIIGLLRDREMRKMRKGHPRNFLSDSRNVRIDPPVINLLSGTTMTTGSSMKTSIGKLSMRMMKKSALPVVKVRKTTVTTTDAHLTAKEKIESQPRKMMTDALLRMMMTDALLRMMMTDALLRKVMTDALLHPRKVRKRDSCELIDISISNYLSVASVSWLAIYYKCNLHHYISFNGVSISKFQLRLFHSSLCPLY